MEIFINSMSGIVFAALDSLPQSLAGCFTVILCSLSVMTFQDTGSGTVNEPGFFSPARQALPALIGVPFMRNKATGSHFIHCRQRMWILFHKELNFPSSGRQF